MCEQTVFTYLRVLLRDESGVFGLAGGLPHLPSPALLPSLKIFGLSYELEVQLAMRARAHTIS